MAASIKGITIKLGGDTTELSKALTGINGKSKSLQSELKQVNKLLKLDSNNVALTAQKEQLLTQAVQATKEKLDTLKEAEAQVQEQFKRGEVSEEQYRALERAVAQTEIELKGYEDKLEEISKTTDETAENTDELAEETEDAGKAAKDSEGSFDTLKVTLGNLAADAIEAVIGKCKELVGEVIDLGIQFGDSMSSLQATSGASAEEIEELENIAREMGATTVFSASEAADALGFMALAGWDTEEMAAGLPGVLNLAAASGMDLAAASDLCTDYLSAFGLEADKAGYMADLLSYAQSNSNTTAQQLGESYKNCAANLNAAGQDIETTTSMLEAMANQGLKGSEAGTALNAIMRDMTAKMKDGAIAIGETNVEVMDADGNFRDLTDILSDVEKATDGMGDAEKQAALQATFTSESTKGLNLILNEGMDTVSGYEEDLRGCTGTAEEMADTMTDNLGGDIKEMQSAMEEAGLAVYDKLEEPLRSVTQFVTSKIVPAVNWILDNLPMLGVIIGGVTATLIALKLASVSAALAENGLTIATKLQAVAQGALNAVMNANPIAIVILAITALVAAFMYLWNHCEAFRNFWLNLWENVKAAFNTCVLYLQVLIEWLKQMFIQAWEAIKLAWDFVQPYFQALWEAIKLIFSVVAEVLGGFFKAAWEAIKLVWDLVSGYFQMVWDNIKLVFSVVKDVLTGNFKGAWEGIKGIWDNASGYFSGIWDKITAVYDKVAGYFKEKFQTAWQNVKDAFSGFVGFFTGLWDSIKETFSSLGTSIASAISGAVRSGINGVISMIENTINSAVSLINGAIGLINKIPGVNIGTVGQVYLPRLAKGGILSNGTALVAEAGPELLSMVNGHAVVTPLTTGAKTRNISEYMGGNSSYTQNVNVSSPKALSPSETARLAKIATRQMIKNIQRG